MPNGSPHALSLHRRIALVTGAARGIGAATALAFARAGARVAVLDRDGAGLERTAVALGAEGAEVLGFNADVADAPAVATAVETIVRDWGRLDILVNNAGILRDATLGDVSDTDWADTLAVNLTGAMICARTVVPYMRAAGFGRILSATSIVARNGNYGQTAYAASKGGIVGMTRVWARELGRTGITANAVAPGFIDTDMVRSIPEKVATQLLARIPAGRIGRADEVANVYLFLASDLASYINGAVVGVDGGLLL
jgi:3-oxoacyl-[acyl-carrier protein] reductase